MVSEELRWYARRVQLESRVFITGHSPETIDRIIAHEKAEEHFAQHLKPKSPLVSRTPVPQAVDALSPTERPAFKSTRSDLLKVEIKAALSRLPAESQLDAPAVLAELAKFAGKTGSCVEAVGPDFVVWRKPSGTPDRVELEALRARLRRLAQED